MERHGFASENFRATRKDAKLKCTFPKFLDDESGATAIEYCLIAAAIALAIIAMVKALGINIAGELASINSQLK
jgi:pilus assembly protein Flp/PilA